MHLDNNVQNTTFLKKFPVFKETNTAICNIISNGIMCSKLNNFIQTQIFPIFSKDIQIMLLLVMEQGTSSLYFFYKALVLKMVHSKPIDLS